ncbi:MAG: T9SS type A sorting domain-containing protein [Chitinophagaceae bacterium]|jgi:hypothetical protein
MKKQMLVMLILGFSLSSLAQTADRQVIGSTGGTYAGASMQTEYTTGEVVTSSGLAGTFTLNQGFHQNPTNGTGIQEKNLTVNFSLFPNPAPNQIALSINTKEAFQLKISLTNVTGQTLFGDEKAAPVTNNYKRDISLVEFSSGVYFVNLYDENNSLLKSIKFIKQ